MKCKIKLSITDEKKKIKIEQLCFINRVWEHFLEDMSLNTLQTTSEMIQPSKVYHKLKKKNRDQYSEPVTTRTKAYKMTSNLAHATSPSTFFYVDDKS